MPPTCLTYDYMHCFWAGGIVECELVLLLNRSSDLGIQQRHLRLFLEAGWEHSTNVRNIKSWFADTGEAFAGFRGNASDLMGVLPALEYFVFRVLAGVAELAKETASFAQLCLAARLLKRSKSYRVVPPELISDIKTALSKHQQLFVEAYSESSCLPKHHCSLHLGEQLERDGFLLDTFVHERKHRLIKQTYNCLRLLPDDVAKTLVTRVCYSQLFQDNHKEKLGLIGVLAPCPESLCSYVAGLDVAAVMVSERVETLTGVIKCNDIVVCNGVAARVISCFGVPGVYTNLLVKSYVKSSSSSSNNACNAASWLESPAFLVVEINDVQVVSVSA